MYYVLKSANIWQIGQPALIADVKLEYHLRIMITKLFYQ